MNFPFSPTGESGLGKSTLLNSLFMTDLFQKHEDFGELNPMPKTMAIEKTTVRMCPSLLLIFSLKFSAGACRAPHPRDQHASIYAGFVRYPCALAWDLLVMQSFPDVIAQKAKCGPQSKPGC